MFISLTPEDYEKLTDNLQQQIVRLEIEADILRRKTSNCLYNEVEVDIMTGKLIEIRELKELLDKLKPIEVTDLSDEDKAIIIKAILARLIGDNNAD